jgi:hypothetical protein
MNCSITNGSKSETGSLYESIDIARLIVHNNAFSFHGRYEVARKKYKRMQMVSLQDYNLHHLTFSFSISFLSPSENEHSGTFDCNDGYRSRRCTASG